MYRNKKPYLSFMLRTVLLAALLGCLFSLTVFADTIRQTGATKDSISISWNTPSDLLYTETLLDFKIQLKKSTAPSSALKTIATLDASDRSYTITGLSSGTQYDVIVNYDLRGKNGWTATRTVGYQWKMSTLSGDVTGLKQVQWLFLKQRLDISWNAQSGCSGYEYVLSKSNGKTFRKGTINSAKTHNLAVTRVRNNMIYCFKIRSFTKVNGKKTYGGWSDPLWCFTQAKVTKAKVNGTSLNVSWKKTGGATGYAVYVSSKPRSGYKKAADVSADESSAVIASLNGKAFSNAKPWYVHVQVLKEDGGKTIGSKDVYCWNTKNKNMKNIK